MASAARSAARTWSGTSTGAFQNAIMPSPMNLSSVPPVSSTCCVSGVWTEFRKPTTSSAESRSEREVKPRMSENSTVRMRVSPPSTRRDGSRARLSTTAGER